MKKIAIQGVPGSYHDIAAHKFFKDEEIELICCNTFEEVFDNLKKDSSIIGMIAIENTIAGSLLHNYELLMELNSIQHSLAPGTFRILIGLRFRMKLYGLSLTMTIW